MIKFPLSLQQYLKDPLKNEFDFNFDNEKSVEIMKKMASRIFDISIIRWYHIKRIRSILISEEVFRDFDIKLLKTFKQVAYMNDSGEIYISLGLLLFKSSMNNLKVLCHELSHIWLSQQSNYLELKTLNKEFKNKYNNDLLSPIELYARVISLKMMNSILESLTSKGQKKRWNRYINYESAKIKELKEMIITL